MDTEESNSRLLELSDEMSTDHVPPLATDCVYCNCPLEPPWIRCVRCSSPAVDLCARCFSHGVEFAQHESDHPYQVVVSLIHSWHITPIILMIMLIKSFSKMFPHHIIQFSNVCLYFSFKSSVA